MSTLTELVAGKTLAQARAYLDEVITAPNPEMITATKIMARLSLQDAATVFGTLRAVAEQNPLVYEALQQLRGDGIDLSHDNAKDMIDYLFAGNPTLAAKLKALGEKQVTRAEANGLGRVKDGHILDALGGA